MGKKIAHPVGSNRIQSTFFQVNDQQALSFSEPLRHDASIGAYGQGQARIIEAFTVSSHRIAGHDINAVVEGTGREVPHP